MTRFLAAGLLCILTAGAWSAAGEGQVPLRASAQQFYDGANALEKKDYVTAEAKLKSLPLDASLDADSRVYAAILLAKLMLDTGRGPEAREQLAKAEALHLSVSARTQVDFELHDSFVLRNVKPLQPKRALELAQRAYVQEPGSIAVQMNLAKSLLARAWELGNQGDRTARMATAKQAGDLLDKMDVGDDRALQSDVKNGQGRARFLQEEWTAALDAFEASQSLLPRSANHRNIGWALVLGLPPRADCVERLRVYTRVRDEFLQAHELHDSNAVTEAWLARMGPQLECLQAQCGQKGKP
jgi:hypothetical protein